MTDRMNSENQGVAGLSAADEQLLKELTERARADGLKLTGRDGLLGKLTKMVVEGALEALPLSSGTSAVRWAYLSGFRNGWSRC